MRPSDEPPRPIRCPKATEIALPNPVAGRNFHASSQLIERIGWALADAEEAERTGNDSTPR
jgi:hypothetical protein